MKEIHERGIRNGLQNLRGLTSLEEIQEIEPHCMGIKGIHVPQTGIIDYPKMAEKLLDLYQNTYGGDAVFGEMVVSIRSSNTIVHVETDKQEYQV